ncbi:winged helix-turn-helix domain-containing protein [Micromonospora sp. CPCC 206061]|uniref:winged helix-turn-helix domain-containing protein n=1 Tax=Micromonospora sp. CPCC 206061 TaxID=3122410 RepID=UPI002FF2B539
MSGDQIRLDPKSLRGVAHPVRVRILGLLRQDGPATSTTLAHRLGLSTGATSYHLRQLAAYGFVVDDTGRGVGRERWWKAAHQRTVLESETVIAAPADAETYLRAVAASYADEIDRWLGERPALPEEWRQGSTLSNWHLRLTPNEAEALREELTAVAERYRRFDAPDAPASARPVTLQVQLMPFAGSEAEGDEE